LIGIEKGTRPEVLLVKFDEIYEEVLPRDDSKYSSQEEKEITEMLSNKNRDYI